MSPRFFTRLWRRMFPAPDESETEDMFMGSDHDPYRNEAPETADHDPNCDACSHFERIGGRWKPPELLLAAGIPVRCLSHKMKISEEDLIEIAESAGLVRQGVDRFGQPRGDIARGNSEYQNLGCQISRRS